MTARPHRVAVLLYEGMSTFETGIVSDVFGLWRHEDGGGRAYEFVVCEQGGPVPGVGGLTLSSRHGLDDLAAADTVVVTGVSDVETEPPDDVRAALRRAHDGGARIASICSGAFALAAAGLLDGRRATTHWRYAELLARRYPPVHVAADVLYVDEGTVLTSAGSAAGIDLCLHLIRRDHGSAVANCVARRMVTPPHRAGGQAQFVETPVPPPARDGAIARAMAHAIARLPEPLTVDCLARSAAMSTRSFARQFHQATGTSPMRWLNVQRVRATLPMLEQGRLTVDAVASRVGMDVVTYRRHFRLEMSTSPSAYRRAFGESAR